MRIGVSGSWASAALRPRLSLSRPVGAGEERDGTRCLIEKGPAKLALTLPSPIRSGRARGERPGRDTSVCVQGRKSLARNPDFGLWTAGLWTNGGTGLVVSSRKTRRNWPSPRPSPRVLSEGETVGGTRTTGRDTLFHREKPDGIGPHPVPSPGVPGEGERPGRDTNTGPHPALSHPKRTGEGERPERDALGRDNSVVPVPLTPNPSPARGEVEERWDGALRSGSRGRCSGLGPSSRRFESGCRARSVRQFHRTDRTAPMSG
jgi:hypothetical protein